MFLIIVYTSASKLLRSSFCGGHFLDLNPKLLFVLLSSSLQSLFSKKKAFHRIRLMTLSVFSSVCDGEPSSSKTAAVTKTTATRITTSDLSQENAPHKMKTLTTLKLTYTL